MIRICAVMIAAACPTVGLAAVPSALECEGDNWSLSLLDDAARLWYPSETRMDVRHVAQAEGAEWPIAMTLLGDRDTGILILEPAATGFDAILLTQRGQTPILLKGMCQTP